MADETKKILIAVYDSAWGESAKLSLQNKGLVVDLSTDGTETLEMIMQQRYSLVLLGLIMPGKTGLEILEELQDVGNETAVLAFSNRHEDGDRGKALGLGAKGYFVRPEMNIDDLTEMVLDRVAE